MCFHSCIKEHFFKLISSTHCSCARFSLYCIFSITDIFSIRDVLLLTVLLEGERERERERENMSQSNNNGLQIFWLVKSYSLIVITAQHLFRSKICSLQGIVCQTFTEKTVTEQQLHMLRCNWLRKYNTKTSEQNLIVASAQEPCCVVWGYLLKRGGKSVGC